ncbi:MAG: hypothetical protein ABI759_17735 [Candidatus Solibacter sp.]
MSKFNLICPAALSVLLVSGAFAQDRDRMRDPDYWDTANNRYTRLVPGTVISVRPNEAIDVERKDNRVYTAIVDQDVRGSNGKLAIPRGSTVELMVRVAADNDLILDLESVNVKGQRYAIKTDATRVDSVQPGLIGAIVGAVNGGEVRGRSVRIPRNTALTFRVDRPLEMGVADRGVDREGRHYHDWYDRH